MRQLTDEQVQEAATALYQAEITRAPINPISSTYPDATIDDAYAISAAVTATKVANGRVVKGHKVGFTSKAMRATLGATEPDYGTLFDDWFVLEGSEIERSRCNIAFAEVELAFVLGADIRGPGITVADLIRAVDFVLPSIEIVDTRQNGIGRSLLIDSVSDAAACGLIVLGGRPMKLTDVDVRRIGASLTVGGVIEESGTGAAVMGNPLNAVVWLINKLAEYGVGAEAGQVLMSGSFLKATKVNAGQTVTALFDQLGEVTFHMV